MMSQLTQDELKQASDILHKHAVPPNKDGSYDLHFESEEGMQEAIKSLLKQELSGFIDKKLTPEVKKEIGRKITQLQKNLTPIFDAVVNGNGDGTFGCNVKIKGLRLVKDAK